MNKPLFSIIIPTYNRAHMLQKAIESVLAQTYINWELIIVDDGSKDNTKEVVKSYYDERIRYIWQKNQERSVARNTGIKNAFGEYICFLDSDDVFLENHLETFYFALEQNDFKFLYSLKVNETERKFQSKYELVFCSVIHSQQVCIHKSLFDLELFNPKIRIGEDLELWMRLLAYTNISCTHKQTILVIDHEERTVNIKNNSCFDHNLLIKNLAKTYRKQLHRTIRNTVISNSYFGIARYYIYQNKRTKAVNNLIISIFFKLNHKQTKYKLNMISKLLNIFYSIISTIHLLEN